MLRLLCNRGNKLLGWPGLCMSRTLTFRDTRDAAVWELQMCCYLQACRGVSGHMCRMKDSSMPGSLPCLLAWGRLASA